MGSFQHALYISLVVLPQNKQGDGMQMTSPRVTDLPARLREVKPRAGLQATAGEAMGAPLRIALRWFSVLVENEQGCVK